MAGDGAGHAARERRDYRIGLVLCAVLTAVPFAAVWARPLGRGATLAVIGLCAAAQVAVQIRYFLHVDLSRARREDLQLLLFAGLLIAILVAGGTWTMGAMHLRMMAP